jgi:hypothetical protein
MPAPIGDISYAVDIDQGVTTFTENTAEGEEY